MKQLIIILLCLIPFLGLSQGNALDFDGNNDRLFVPSVISGNSDFTLEFWIYSHDDKARDDLYMTWFGPNSRFEIRTDASGRFAIFQYDGRYSWQITNTYILKNTWYHIAVTRSNNICKLYLDGELKKSFTPIFTLGNQFRMFFWNGSSSFHVKGKLDELRLWNLAKSQEDINESMNCELDGDEPNLVGYWNFNQEIPGGNNAGKTSVYDQSINNQIGTLHNFSLNGSASNWIESDADIPKLCSCHEDDVEPPMANCIDITVELNENGEAIIIPAMVNNNSTDQCTDQNDLILGLSKTVFDCDDLKGGPASWMNVGYAGFSAGSANFQSLAFYNGDPYVAFSDFSQGAKSTVMKYNGTDWVNVGNAGFTTGAANQQSLAFYNGDPYVAFRDHGNGRKTTLMKYNGTNWVNIGNAGFSAGEAAYQSLAFNDGNPYISYRDWDNDFKTTVMKFNGTNWVNVGSPGFSAGDSHYQSLAFYNNEPYVAYRDGGSGNKTSVMKFNGSNWVNVGSPGFSTGEAHYQSLAFYNNEPYVAYRDGGIGNKTTVMKYNGTSWVNVGSPGFSAGEARYQSLAFNDGTPYVAYKDEFNGNKSTVMKFDGTSWVSVGSSGFSAGNSSYQRLAFQDDEPYVAYLDYQNGNRTTVMNFAPTPINTLLTVTDEAGNVSNCSSTVTVVDLTAPNITTPCPSDINLCGAQNVTWTEPSALDNCSDVNTTSSHTPGDYFDVGSNVVTYQFTDDYNNTSSCSFTITIHPLPQVMIIQSLLPEFCQGTSLLGVDLINENELTTPFSYSWSDGLGNDEEATVFSNGSYSVSVTDGRGCQSEGSTIVNEEESDIFSSYVLLANSEIITKRTTISGGGIGVYGTNKKVKLLKSSIINTFAKAPIVQVKSGSSLNRSIIGAVDVALPDFKSNPSNCTNDIVVNAGETITLTSNNYGKITVKADGVLIVDSPEWYVNEIDMKQYSELKFEQATNVMVKTKMKLNKNVILNISGEAVRFYIEETFDVMPGTDFSAHVYAKQKIHAKKAKNSNQTYMRGTFFSEDRIQSDDFVNWDWAEFCNDEDQVADPNNCEPAPFSAVVKEFDQVDNSLETMDQRQLDEITMSPNPTSGMLNIDLSALLGQHVEINIFDYLGHGVEHIEQKNITNPQLSFNLTEHSGVTFLVQMIINGNKKLNKRIVILKL